MSDFPVPDSDDRLLLEETVRFHGHLCPGLAIGFRATAAALDRLGASRAEDEELVAIVENESCAVDAVQWITGCTFGKGNLLFRDYGKHVYTWFDRRTGRAVRVALLRKDRRIGEPPVADRAARSRWILEAPLERLFEISTPQIEIPAVAVIREAVVCDQCGEEAMSTRMADHDGRKLCRPCLETETTPTE